MNFKLYAGAFVLGITLTSTAFAQRSSSADKAAPPNTGATTPGGASVGTMNAGNNPQANAADERRAEGAARSRGGKATRGERRVERQPGGAEKR